MILRSRSLVNKIKLASFCTFKSLWLLCGYSLKKRRSYFHLVVERFWHLKKISSGLTMATNLYHSTQGFKCKITWIALSENQNGILPLQIPNTKIYICFASWGYQPMLAMFEKFRTIWQRVVLSYKAAAQCMQNASKSGSAF